MSLTPARDEKLERQKKDAMELCGKNRGPHDFIPIEVVTTGNIERVTRFLCRVCFSNISTQTILERYPDVSYV